MNERLHIHKKSDSSVPVFTKEQPRLVTQSPREIEQQQNSGSLLQRLENESRFGHNLNKIAINLPEQNPPSSIQPKLIIGRKQELPSPLMMQPKLTIGAPGDKYEQEADRIASQVVNQINTPIPPTQREPISEEDELMMKPEIGTIQREEVPEEDELQMKPTGGMPAVGDIEASIQQARGSGQPLADRIRQPMERAFGADFSNVKVHNDTQSDKLNQSIQAKAFTTGQDIFFRQGEYNPSNKGGQELLAHELTHVVQQNGNTVQSKKLQLKSKAKDITIQRTIQGYAAKKSKEKDKDLTKYYNLVKEAAKGTGAQVQKNSVKSAIDRLENSQHVYVNDDDVVTGILKDLGLSRAESSTSNLAQEHKQQQIQPYLDLLNHMAGEEKGGQVQGGHLLTDMQAQWGGSLEYQFISGDRNGMWNMQWRAKPNQTFKQSTMFPEAWTNDDLRLALNNSTVIANALYLPHGQMRIKIKKAGNTFYPDGIA